MIHEKKAFWDTRFAGDLNVRARQDHSFAEFDVGDLAEVSEEIGGYVSVFKHHFLKVRQGKCYQKRVLKLDWQGGPHNVNRQAQAN